jgi:hypothetical protein
MVRHAPQSRPLVAALAALAATLLLGGFGPALAGPAGLLSWELFGLAIAGGAGFLAWHLAQLTALPPAPVTRAALPAALAPLIVFPHIGALGTGPVAAAAAGGAMLAAAWLCRARCPAANDNPSLERMRRFWPMPASLHYAREIARDSGSEFGE